MWVCLFISISILIGIVIFMPQKITKVELYTGYFFMLVLSWSLNVAIDAKYNLRSFFQMGPDHLTMLIYIVVFPCIGCIFLNFFPFKQKSIIKKTAYIFLSVLIFLGYDALLVKANILHYYNWNYVYSILLYITEFLFVLLNIKIVNYLGNTDS